MAVLSWPDVTFPTNGFNPDKGKPYIYNKVRHPETDRFEYEGKMYVVCTAIPVDEVANFGSMASALDSVKLPKV